MTYRTKGTCSMAIQVELAPDHTIEHVDFIGGCSGNTQGVAIIVQGMKAEDAREKIEGIRFGDGCGNGKTVRVLRPYRFSFCPI